MYKKTYIVSLYIALHLHYGGIFYINGQSYYCLRRQPMRLSSTYDTMPENPHREFSTGFSTGFPQAHRGVAFDTCTI